MKDLKGIILGILIGLPLLVITFTLGLYVFGCGSTNSCTGIALPEMTSIPTLLPATLPAPKVGADAAPLKPTCHIAALDLIGAWVSAGYKETDPFSFTDVAGQNCTATFKDDVQKLFLTPNLWYDGAPACTTCHYADVKKATKNMDLSSYAGILAGSGRANGEPKGNDILGGGNWDQALLHNMLFAPGGKTTINRPPMPLGRPANVPAKGPVISAGIPGGSQAAAAIGPTPTNAVAGPTPTAEAVEIARPSNPGGPGTAIKTKGDANIGAQIFAAHCAACHGSQGQEGIPNPGSDDGSVPNLNPIDSTLVNPDYTTFATNVDLFIQHGSVPAGSAPVIQMPAWGDKNYLSQPEISNLIAYVIDINQARTAAEGPAPAPTVAGAATPTTEPVEIARPSNPGGPGDAIKTPGDAIVGEQIFVARCSACHGDQGRAGIPNPGSEDGSVPTLNPIDSTLVNPDYTTFATNLDLFLQHGSTPSGPSPVIKMPAWGDQNMLSQQDIANLIAYLILLNKK